MITDWWSVSKSLIVFRIDEDARNSAEGMLLIFLFSVRLPKGNSFLSWKKTAFSQLCDSVITVTYVRTYKDKGFVHFFVKEQVSREHPVKPTKTGTH